MLLTPGSLAVSSVAARPYVNTGNRLRSANRFFEGAEMRLAVDQFGSLLPWFAVEPAWAICLLLVGDEN